MANDTTYIEENKTEKALVCCKMEKRENPSFAKGLNFYKLFWIFFIGAFLGVVIESFVCIAELHRLESRAGVVYGPFNPVYGFGAVLITIVLDRIKGKNNIWIFTISMIAGAAFEFLCSQAQEIMFGTISWEYSEQTFNIAGRTSLFYGLCWGFLGIFWIRLVYPWISKTIENIPNKFAIPITWVLIVFMIFNMTISTMAAVREEERRQNIPATKGIQRFLDKHYDSEFMNKVYPNARPVRTPPKEQVV